VVGVIRNVRAGAVDTISDAAAALSGLHPEQRRHDGHRENRQGGRDHRPRLCQTSSGAWTSNLPIPAIRAPRDDLQQIVMSGRLRSAAFRSSSSSLFAVVSPRSTAGHPWVCVRASSATRSPVWTRDFGLRLALGARASRNLWSCYSRTGMRARPSSELIAGMTCAVVVGAALRGLLLRHRANRSVALGGSIAGLLLVTAATACYLPARRASSHLDPLTPCGM
jgi:hypothetical protein